MYRGVVHSYSLEWSEKIGVNVMKKIKIKSDRKSLAIICAEF